MTRHALIACLLAAGTLTTACTPSLIAANKPQAVKTAETRARYDLACAKPKGSVVSAETMPATPTPPPPLFNASDIANARFDVAIAGCGAERKVQVMCSQEEGCFAGQPG